MEIQEHLKTEPPRIFLSYAKEDLSKIRKIYKRLKNEQLTPWLDMEDLLPGDDWEKEILSAIRSARFVLVFVSQRSVNKRGYIQKEIREALDVADRLPEGQIFIIPIRLENCLVPDRLCKWQWVDIFVPDGFSKLIRAIRRNLAPEELRKPQPRSQREVAQSQKALSDATLIEFIKNTGQLAIGKLDRKRTAISNGHILDIFSRTPEWLSSLKNEITDIKVISKAKMEMIFSTGEPYNDAKFLFESASIHKESRHAHVLTTQGGIRCGIQSKYFNYIISKYPTAEIYIRSETMPIIFKVAGKLRGVVMPYRVALK